MDARAWLGRARAGLREHEAERGPGEAARRHGAAVNETAVGEPTPAGSSPAPAATRPRAIGPLPASPGVVVGDRPALDPAAGGGAARSSIGSLRSPARSIGPYTITGELGRGGMGVVYVARSDKLDRLVALKVLRAEREEQRELAVRFDIEARAAARLRHPNIVGVHDVGEEAGQRYLVMELVPGRSLAARLKAEGPLPTREAARIAERVARALAYAHTRWVLHRDVKPANVLLDEAGEPRLGDFGLAKVLEEGAKDSPTVSGQVMGTPTYMAPEQARGQQDRIDGRSDVYALGATLHEMLTGQPPWVASTVVATLALVTGPDPLPPPSRLRPDLDRDLETICLRALEKEPQDRYAAAADLAEDLRRWLADEPILARRPTPGERARRWLRRNRPLARLLGLLLLVVGAGAATGSWQFVARLREERNRADLAAAEAELQARNAASEARRAAAEARRAAEEAARAEERAEVAREALRVLVYEVKDKLAEVPGERVRRVRAELLDAALKGLERLGQAEAERGAPSIAAAEAQRQIGELRLVRQGDGAKGAVESYGRAVAILRDLLAREAAAGGPGVTGLRHDLALALVRLADLERSLAPDGAAAKHAAEALALAEALASAPGPAQEDARVLEVAALLQVAIDAQEARDLPRAAELLERAAERGRAVVASGRGQTDPWRRQKLVDALQHLARVREEQGALPRAVAALEEAAAVARPGVFSESTRPRLLRDLATVRSKQGDLAGAQGASAEGIAALRSAVAADPGQVVLVQELAVGLDAQADLFVAAGDHRRGVAAAREAVELLRPLVRDAPGDQGLLLNLAAAQDDLARLLDLAGDAKGSLAVARETVAAYDALLATTPQDAGVRWDRSVAMCSLGRRLARGGDVAGAMKALEDSLAARRALVADTPASARYRQGLCAALQEVSSMAFAQGDLPRARALADEGLGVARGLHADDPTNLEHHQNLVFALQARGKSALEARDLDGAERAFAEAWTEGEALVARDAARRGSRQTLGIVGNQLGKLRLARGDLAGATKALEGARALFQALVASGDSPDDRRDEAVSTSMLGEVREAAGDVPGALALYEEGAARMRALARGGESGLRRDLGIQLERVAGMLRKTPGGTERARAVWTECLELRRALLAEDPRSALALRDVSGALVGLANLTQRAGELQASVALWTEAVANHEALVAVAPRFEPELAQLRTGLAQAQADLADQAVATGQRPPADTRERLVLAYALQDRREHVAAAAAFAAALADPAVRQDDQSGHFYNGACAASLASAVERQAGRAEAASALADQALAWLGVEVEQQRALVARADRELLRVDLSAAQRKRVEKAKARAEGLVAHARTDADLDPIRGLPGFQALIPAP